MQIIDTVKISIDDIFYTNDKVEVTLDNTGEFKSIKKLLSNDGVEVVESEETD